jgi:hypothetical protein
MKHIIIFLSTVLFSGSDLFAQNIDRIIAEVEKNNTTLIALKKDVDAEHIGNKTGLYLRNPEFAFNYLWGSPHSIGNRKDISILQSFDFPTAYGYRNQISEYRNIQVELEYEKQRRSIITRTRLVCNELIYLNLIRAELAKRSENARKLAESYKTRYDIGEAGLIDYNKAQVNLLNVIKAEETNEIEKKALLAELKILNGGIAVEFTDSVFQLQPVANDFDQWYIQVEQNNPVLQWLKQEVSISRKNEKLNTAMSFPKLQAGYMSEEVVGQQYQGITFGLTIPLLENKNAVKYARAKTAAIESVEADTKLQFYNNLKALHTKAISLQNSVNDYQFNLQEYNNSGLLLKALDKGELSLAEYFFELSMYYESIDRLLVLKKSLSDTVTELNRYQ